jgi:cytoskeletal protein RodZ
LEESDKMDKKKFGKIMDDWVVHEMEAAPDLEPSPKVYQRLAEKKKKTRFVLFSWPVRLAAAGIAAALIILVIVIKPPREVEPLLGLKEGAVTDVAEKKEVEDRMQVVGEAETEEEVKQKTQDAGKPETAKLQKKVVEEVKRERIEEKDYVGEEPSIKTRIVEKIEKAEEADKKMFAQPTVVAARPRKEIAAVAPAAPEEIVPGRIEFQYQPKGSEDIKKLDIDSPQDEIISLSSEDNYRLILQLPQERYVYVIQVGAEEQPIRLFPNQEYSPSENPLQAGKATTIPLPPNWFYVEKDEGDVLLYVVTSIEPLFEWDDIDAKISAEWLEWIEKNKGKPEDRVSTRVFKFNIH